MRTTKWASASTAGEALILQFLCEPSPSLHKTASSEALDNVFLRSKGIQSPSPSGTKRVGVSEKTGILICDILEA